MMERDCREDFEAGTRLVGYIGPRPRPARGFDAPDRSTLLGDDGVLDGGDVLPGFAPPLRERFDRAGRGPDA